jgi:UDP-N-acetylglucosamine--N-acetylmuramyl-(pentapeptide) pyrophosphoryl-undecaprenol N-acetylglucosamine transferase
MRVIIAGGGTGGHLFPGIAVAERLKTLRSDCEVFHLCTEREIDGRELARAGLPFEALPSASLRFSPTLMIKFPFRSCAALRRSIRRLRDFRPDAVVGVGGYGCFWPLVAGKIRNVPVLLLEQNVLPGRANRALAHVANEICVQWPASAKYFEGGAGIYHTGNPLRGSVREVPKADAREALGLDRGTKTLAVMGGSQGAHAVNAFVADNASSLVARAQAVQVIHITGPADVQSVKDAYAKAGLSKAIVLPFTDKMAEVYCAADLVICRAGGTTIAEATALGVPLVLVPYPHAANNHQYYNAAEVMSSGAGMLIEEPSLSPEAFRGVVDGLFFDDARLAEMAKRSRAAGRPNAADEVARLILRACERGAS